MKRLRPQASPSPFLSARKRPGLAWLCVAIGALMLVGALAPGCELRKEGGEEGTEGSVADASRIVTLGSSVTEIVYALGRGDDVVGVDASSLYPAAASETAQLPYYRMVKAEPLLALEPTVVIAIDGAPGQVLDQLASAGVEVVRVGAGESPAATRERIEKVSASLGETEKGESLLERLDGELSAAKVRAERCQGDAPLRVAVVYLRGPRAQMLMGEGTGADVMLDLAGAENAIAKEGAFPVSAEGLIAASPDVVLVPERSLESVGGEAGLAQVPGVAAVLEQGARVESMDDLELLGFGPRLGSSVENLTSKLHPGCD